MNDFNIQRTLAVIRAVPRETDTVKKCTWKHCPNRKNWKQLKYLEFVREKGAQISFAEFDPDYTRKPNFLPERYDFGWLKGEETK